MPIRGGLPRSSEEVGNSHGAKEAGHSRQDRLGQVSTGGTEWLWQRVVALINGTSGVNGEVYARFCERPG
jgi:hypothetical protein